MGEGIKHDTGKPMMAYLPAVAIEEVAKVMTFGAAKYGAFNWLGGIVITRLLSAGLRHIFAYLKGEDLDPESGYSHLAHAGACMLMALETYLRRPDKDDRYKESN